MIKVSVFAYDSIGSNHRWWLNFIAHYEELSSFLLDGDRLDKALEDWNATNIEETEFISFKTEQDYLLFVLRWS